MSDGAPSGAPSKTQFVVIVASLGGQRAITTVLNGLPATFPGPIAVVQHRALGADDQIRAEIIRRRCDLPVRVAAHGDPAAVPGVTLLPAGCVATLDADLCYQLALPGRGWPDESGDRLLASVAHHSPGAAIGVVLTGRLHDGTEGVRAIKRAGGRVLVQEPRTAQAAEMPSSAAATGCVDHVLPLEKIAPALTALVMAPGGAKLLAVPTPAWAQLGA